MLLSLLSALFVSCNKDVNSTVLPEDDVKIIQSSAENFSSSENEYFTSSIKSVKHNDKYLYSFVINNPTKELNNFHALIVDLDNRGYISYFGYDGEYSLILGDKKENDNRVIGININFDYSFEATSFKLYAYFKVNNADLEVKNIVRI